MKRPSQLYKTVFEVLERAKKAQHRVDQFYEQIIDMMEQLKQRMTSQKRRSGCSAPSCASPPSQKCRHPHHDSNCKDHN